MSNDLPPRARQDPVLCLAPGLFRSLGPKDRPRDPAKRGKPLELSYSYNPSTSFVFRSPVLLGCDDLRVLQGVVSLAARSRTVITATVTSPRYGALRDAIGLIGDAEHAWVLLVETNFSELARASGYGRDGDVQGGAMRKHLRACLRRLANLSVLVQTRGEGGDESKISGWQLMSHDLPDEEEEQRPAGAGKNSTWGDIQIALNPRSSRAAIAHRKAPFTDLDMMVSRELHGNVARLLHHRLSGLTDRKHATRGFRLDTLIGYAWGPALHSSPDACDRRSVAVMDNAGAARKRRMGISAALDDLRRTGWSVVPKGKAYPDTVLIKKLGSAEIEVRRAAWRHGGVS